MFGPRRMFEPCIHTYSETIQPMVSRTKDKHTLLDHVSTYVLFKKYKYPQPTRGVQTRADRNNSRRSKLALNETTLADQNSSRRSQLAPNETTHAARSSRRSKQLAPLATRAVRD